MAIVVPDTVEVAVLEWLLKTADLKLKLFANNYEPNENSVAASFTEVSGGGYGAKTLTAGAWTVTSGAPSQGVYAQQIFSFTGVTGGSGVIYGYYVTDVAGTNLYFAESLPGTVSPFTPTNGSTVKITPVFQAS